MTLSLDRSVLTEDTMKDLFHLMVDEIEETAIFLMDTHGVITAWNDGARVMKGYTAEEAIGQFFGMLYLPDDRNRMHPQHNLEKAAEHGYYREETWRQRKDGSLFWARIAITALRDANHTLLGFSKITIDMTAHKQLEECVEEKQENRRIMEAASAGTWSWNPVSGFMKISGHLAHLLGFPAEQHMLSRAQLLRLIHRRDRHNVEHQLSTENLPAPTVPGTVVLEVRVRSLSGKYQWLYVRALWRLDLDKREAVLDGVGVAIQELRSAQAERERLLLQLQSQERRARITLASIADGVIAADEAGRVTSLNPAAARLTGWRAEDALGQSASNVFNVRAADPVDGDTERAALCPITLCLSEDRVVLAPRNAIVQSRTGEAYSVGYSCAPLHIDEQAQPVGAVLVIHDVTESKILLDDLSHQASHDALTGLLNRREFSMRLQRTLDRVRGQPLHGAALLYMDLDQFKIVNDTCGHTAGDDLLQQLAIQYSSHVRERDTLARLGGDEFALIVEHCTIEEALVVANKVLATTRDFRYTCNGQSFQIGVSIGLIPIHQGSASVEDALRLADHACYIAKEAGRHRVFVQKVGDIDVQRRRNDMHWVSRLGESFGNGQLQLYCQPIRALGREQQGLHYEVLLRIGEHGANAVEPKIFLPAAERYDLMPKVDRWVLATTIAWLEDNADHVDQLEMCSVNVSQRALADDSFREFAVELLRSTTVPASKLCFEITETGACANLHNTLGFIEKLKALGCRFALDDFGTGMASFAYLKQIPVDFVKIDGSFISMMLHSRVDFEMVRFTNEISHVMGRQTIAEYVADDATLRELQSIGVDFAQGYLLGEPRPLGMTKLQPRATGTGPAGHGDRPCGTQGAGPAGLSQV
jgi:diguanylate cyclase (GGDEF)-like protein/PAS domain S-box-containing protein